MCIYLFKFWWYSQISTLEVNNLKKVLKKKKILKRKIKSILMAWTKSDNQAVLPRPFNYF